MDSSNIYGRTQTQYRRSQVQAAYSDLSNAYAAGNIQSTVSILVAGTTDT